VTKTNAKSKPKMVKLKKSLKLVYGKPLNTKVIASIIEKKSKFSAKSQKQTNVKIKILSICKT
jgi:hypothetical protein